MTCTVFGNSLFIRVDSVGFFFFLKQKVKVSSYDKKRPIKNLVILCNSVCGIFLTLKNDKWY